MTANGIETPRTNQPLLVAYFPLADPLVRLDLLDAYADTGVDVVEFGWPAHDPFLDGPDVRGSMQRAAAGDPRGALDAAASRLSKRGRSPKRLVMTYAEAGHPALVDPAFFSSIDAILVVSRERDPLRLEIEARAEAKGVALSIFVPLPVSRPSVLRARRASGYVMLQAAAGLTGPRDRLDADNGHRIAALRAEGVTAPIVIGFGVSRGAQARRAIDLGADGVVVGSAVLRAALLGRSALSALLTELREGLDVGGRAFPGTGPRDDGDQGRPV